MSNRQLEERQERERAEWVASAIGLPVAELDELVWDVHEIDGHDGAVYGYRVEFDTDTDPAVIRRLGGHSLDIGFPPEGPEPEDMP